MEGSAAANERAALWPAAFPGGQLPPRLRISCLRCLLGVGRRRHAAPAWQPLRERAPHGASLGVKVHSRRSEALP